MYSMSELDKRIGEFREQREEHARATREARASYLSAPVPPKKLEPIDRINRQEQVPIGSADFLSLETRVNLFQFAISCAAKGLDYDRVAPLTYKSGGRDKIVNPPILMRLRHQRVGWMVNRGTTTISTGSYNSGYGEIGTIEYTADATTHLYVQKDDPETSRPTIWVPPHETKASLSFDEGAINASLFRITLFQHVELVPLTPDQENGVF